LKILFVSAEVAPFAKVGGLADVIGSLPRALRARGHDVRVLMPAYGMVLKDKRWDIKKLASFDTTLNPFEKIRTTIHETDDAGVPIWMIAGGKHFDGVQASEAIYTPSRDAYLFLSQAALQWCERSNWIPDVVHAHDWHTGFLPVLMREGPADLWDRVASIYTIHNLAYQGEFGLDTLDKVGLPHCLFNMHQLETYGAVNFLKSACVYADRINTVSPTYAEEIQWPEYGCRLEGLMTWLAADGRLSGILNGVDTEHFDPQTDPAIESPYSAMDLTGKPHCRTALLQELDLSANPKTPVIGMVSRLSEQKGFDLVLQALDRIVAEAQLVVLGIGDPWAAEQLRAAQARFPDRVRLIERFDVELAQRIYAGVDMFLMPSAYEPCGLGQMIAMRYGSVPIVRKTGGLADTVFDTVNGFTFAERTPDALFEAIWRATEAFAKPKTWVKFVQAGMTADFSWDRSAGRYEELYEEATASRRGLQRA